MVRACAVPQCSSGVTIPAYHFPKGVVRSESWANKIQCPVLLKLTSTERRRYRVCYRHFEETSFLRSTQRRRLRYDAIPTLHLPVQSQNKEYASENIEAEVYPVSATTVESDNNNEHKSLIKNCMSEEITERICEETLWDINEHNEAGPSSSIISGQLEQCSISQKSHRNILLQDNMKQCQLTPKAAKLYKIAKTLMKRNRYAHRKREDLKARLERAMVLSESNLVHRFQNLSTTQRMFIEMQLRTSRSMPQVSKIVDVANDIPVATQHFQPATTNRTRHVTTTTTTTVHMGGNMMQAVRKGRRYTTDEKILALALLKQSSKSYRLLRMLCNLPSATTLKKMLRKIPIKTGISQAVMKHLRGQADTMSAQEKLCVLMWDEMSLMPHVDYDVNEDKIIGFEDWGTRRTSRFADHALVFMLRGLHSGWKMPISYNYCDSQTKAPQLIQCIKNVVKALKKTGIEVVATVCDQGSSNVAAINTLQADTLRKKWKQGEEHRDIIEVDGIQLIPLYDPPHLIKGIRNNLLNKDLEINVTPGRKECERQFASWRIIEQAYNMDISGYVVRPMMKRLTNEHVVPEKIPKMKVKYASQVFSETVASHIGFLSRHQCVVETDHGPLKIPKEEGLTTAEVLNFFNKLFDSVNGHSAATEAQLRTVISEASAHEEFWSDAIKYIKCMRYVHPLTKMPVSGSLCLKNWMKTISAFQVLWRLLKTQGFKNFKTRLINQDPLENFFGCIRSVGHQNVHPTPYGFQVAYKNVLINNITSSQSIGFNCEDVCSGHFLFTLKKLLTEEEEEDIQSAVSEVIMEETSAASQSTENIAQEEYEEINNCAIVKKIICTSPHKECQLCKASFCRFNEDASIQNVLKKIDIMLHKTMPHVYFRSKLQEHMENMLHDEINLSFIKCKQHVQQLRKRILTVKISYFINKWCTTVNNILCGKDVRRRQDAVLQQALLKQMKFRRSVRKKTN
ncbi:uncharacterized protein LOC143187475 [Calliopsis andreniformis]|uniref:uncharacterized protein LOC143187475 n=1 Tax=Calliopsis andreniformis TaxID=337506 RepID=UPI003FCCBDFC